MEIKIVENPTKDDLQVYKTFSSQNWGEQVEANSTIDEEFFASPSVVLTVVVDHEQVGLVYLYLRDISFLGKNVRLGGVGGVVTKISFRKQGIATKLLRKANEVMKSKGVDVAILSTDIGKLGKLYAKAGFVPLGRPYYYLDKSEREGEDTGGMIAPISSNELFELILQNPTQKLIIGKSNI